MVSIKEENNEINVVYINYNNDIYGVLENLKQQFEINHNPAFRLRQLKFSVL